MANNAEEYTKQLSFVIPSIHSMHSLKIFFTSFMALFNLPLNFFGGFINFFLSLKGVYLVSSNIIRRRSLRESLGGCASVSIAGVF